MVVIKSKRIMIREGKKDVIQKRRIQMKRLKAAMSVTRPSVITMDNSLDVKEPVVKKQKKKIRTKKRKVVSKKVGVNKRRRRTRRKRSKRTATEREAKVPKLNKEDLQGYCLEKQCDQGWAWLIMLGGSIWLFLFVGTLKSFGLLYVAFQELFQCSPSEASTVSLLFGIIQIIAAPVSGLVADYSKNRVLLVMCGLVASAGGIATSQASSLPAAIIFFGILTGVPASVLDVVTISMVGKYFKKYRTFANSVMCASSSISTLAIPQVYAATQEAFNSRTAILTFGGLWLNACVVAALMRPFKMTTGSKESSHDLKDKERCSDFAERMHLQNENTKVTEDQILESSTNFEMITNGSEIVNAASVYNKHTDNRTQVIIYDESDLEISLGRISDSTIKKDTVACRIDYRLEGDSKADVTGPTQEKVGCPDVKIGPSTHIQNFLTAVKSYCSLLKNSGLIVRIIALNLLSFAYLLPVVVIPPLCKELNFDIQRTVNLITVSGCVEIPASIIIGLLTDRFGWRPVCVLAVSTSIPAVVSVIVILLPRYDVLMIFSCFHGLFSGRALAFFNTTLTEAVDISDLGRAMALMLAMNGAIAALLTPTVGLVKEASGTHLYVFAVSASAALLGNIFYISISCIESRRKAGKQF